MNFIELNFHCSHTILYIYTCSYLFFLVPLIASNPSDLFICRFLVCDCLHSYLLICALVLSIHISSSPPPCSYSISLIPHLSPPCLYIPYFFYLLTVSISLIPLFPSFHIPYSYSNSPLLLIAISCTLIFLTSS